jgi:hypothetical protein
MSRKIIMSTANKNNTKSHPTKVLTTNEWARFVAMYVPYV